MPDFVPDFVSENAEQAGGRGRGQGLVQQYNTIIADAATITMLVVREKGPPQLNRTRSRRCRWPSAAENSPRVVLRGAVVQVPSLGLARVGREREAGRHDEGPTTQFVAQFHARTFTSIEEH